MLICSPPIWESISLLYGDTFSRDLSHDLTFTQGHTTVQKVFTFDIEFETLLLCFETTHTSVNNFWK